MAGLNYAVQPIGGEAQRSLGQLAKYGTYKAVGPPTDSVSKCVPVVGAAQVDSEGHMDTSGPARAKGVRGHARTHASDCGQ